MKQNIIGIIGGIMAFISLALPWWTLTMSYSTYVTSFSGNVSIYPYQATASYAGSSVAVSISLWYCWAALVLVLIGGLLGIVGSLAQSTRMMLVIGGLLAAFAVIIFALGLQAELSDKAVVTGYPIVSLFSSESFMGGALNYTTYLSSGFWLVLVAAFLMLVASRKKTPSVAPPPTQESQSS